jgi:hypothetical protein
MMRKVEELLMVSLLAGVVACGGDDDDGDDSGTMPDAGADVDSAPAVCTVTEWTAPGFADNSADALALRAQLDALGTLMRGAEQETMTVDDVADLTALYDDGDPSLTDVTSASFAPIVADVFADFVALTAASVQDLVDADGNWAPGKVGGLFGPDVRGINTGGLEVRQLVDKGVFGGAGHYAYALGLTEGEITEATIDALAAAWGTDAALGTEELADSANYGFQMGFHAEITDALTAAKSFAANDNCETERDAALVTFFRTWEVSLVARTIYYANAASTLIATAPAGPDGDAAKADALHELSEGIGLTLGFYGLAHPASGPLAGAGRVLTDENVESMMTSLGVDIEDLSASTTGTFVGNAAGIAAGVTAFETTAAEVFDLDEADLTSFRTPTEG